MKCQHCGSEWKTGKCVTTIDKCPFCGKPLTVEKPEKKMTLAVVLHQLIEDYGIEIISNQKKCISVFKDIAPQLKDEQKILNLALSLGVAEHFMSCKGKDYNDNIQKAKIAMDFLNDEAKELVVAAFVEALGWSKNAENDRNKKQQKKAKYNIPRIKKDAATNKRINGIDKNNKTEKREVISADEQYIFGEKYFNDKNYIEAAKWYQNAAEQGHAEAQNSLGWMYANGIGVKRNDSIAVNWYRKSAEQGNADAQNHLGWMFGNGSGVDQDYAEAMRWYRKAAREGLAEAEYNIGWLYEDGNGVKQDYEKAIKWYNKAKDDGYEGAKFRIERLRNKGLLKGNVGKVLAPKNTIESIREGNSVRDNNKYAQQGNLVAKETFFEKNERLMKQGSLEAMYNLGYCYEFGFGVTERKYRAFTWYKRAAEQGYLRAQFELANCYFNGKGVEKDIVQAKFWYEKAAKQGHETSKVMLEKLNKLMKLTNESSDNKDLKIGLKNYQNNTGTRNKNLNGGKEIDTTLIRYFANADTNIVKMLAEQGVPEAQSELARRLNDKKEIEPTNIKNFVNAATNIVRKSAEQGVPEAQYELARRYDYGRTFGIKEDKEKAFEWYKKAAEQGYSRAQNKLGDFYYYGIGVKKNYDEALKWYGKAAKQGNAEAYKNFCDSHKFR